MLRVITNDAYLCPNDIFAGSDSLLNCAVRYWLQQSHLNTLQYLHLINLKFNSNYRHTAIIYCNYLIYVLLLFEERRLRRYSIEMVKTSHTATIYS